MAGEGKRHVEGNYSPLSASERIRNTIVYGGAGGMLGAMVGGVPGAVLGTLLAGSFAATERKSNFPQ